MSEIAIRVEGLGKKYRLGAGQEPYHSLRDTVAGAASTPLKLAKWLAKGARGADNFSRKPEFWALKDVNFEVKQGEVLGVIGRNGAGKSTLLKLVSEITEPTEGRIALIGRVASLLEVGTGFHPELTGRENTFLNGAILGMGRSEVARKFDEIVAFAEVEQFIDTQVKHYSSGMYMRLAFAVAAHLEPEILIIDEVLAVGDAVFQKKCLGKMAEVSRTGRTILFVSHSVSAITSLCSRCLLLDTGALAQDGLPAVVIDSYMSSVEAGDYAQQIARSNRRGNGEVQFVDFTIENRRGDKLQEITSGEECTIRLAYASSSNAELRNCRVSLAINDALGQMLFLCSSETTYSGELKLPPSGTIDCLIPRFPLSIGRYYATLFFERATNIEDLIESGVVINVVDGGFFRGSRQYPVGFGGRGVLVDHVWKAQ